MTAKRLAALAGALLLIVGAAIFRSLVDSGDESIVGRDSTPVVCDPLVIDACRTAFEGREVVVEDPGETLDRLLSGQRTDPFVWITPDVWLEILASESDRTGRVDPSGGTEGPFAHTDVVLVATDGRDECVDLSWACLAAEAAPDDGGGGLDIGLDPPDTTIGLLARGELAAGFFGRSDFSSNDFDSPEFRVWRSRIADRLIAPSRSTAIDDLLVLRGRLDVAPATRVAWQRASRSGYEAQPPPDGTRTVRIAAASIGDASADADRLVDALVGAGWDPVSNTPTSNTPTSNTGDAEGEVSPGVLQALRSR